MMVRKGRTSLSLSDAKEGTFLRRKDVLALQRDPTPRPHMPSLFSQKQLDKSWMWQPLARPQGKSWLQTVSSLISERGKEKQFLTSQATWLTSVSAWFSQVQCSIQWLLRFEHFHPHHVLEFYFEIGAKVWLSHLCLLTICDYRQVPQYLVSLFFKK